MAILLAVLCTSTLAITALRRWSRIGDGGSKIMHIGKYVNYSNPYESAVQSTILNAHCCLQCSCLGPPQYHFEHPLPTDRYATSTSGNTTPTQPHAQADHRQQLPLAHNWLQNTATLSAKNTTPPTTAPTTPPLTVPRDHNHKKSRHRGNERNLRIPSHVCRLKDKSTMEPTEIADPQEKQPQKNWIDISITRSSSSGSLEHEILLSGEQANPVAYNSISDRPPCQLPDNQNSSGLRISDVSSSGLRISDVSSASPTPVTAIRESCTFPRWNKPSKYYGHKQTSRTSDSGSSEHYVNEGMGPPNTKFHNKK